MTNQPDEESTATTVFASYGVIETRNPDRVLHATVDQWLELGRSLLNDDWTMCVDLTCVDYSSYSKDRKLPEGVQPERFEVVATFVSHSNRQRLQARVQVPGDTPKLASLYAIYPGVDFAEREVFDMFGIVFEGHPDLSRILMPEGWTGHPLRKDYATGTIPVQFKAPSENPPS